MDTEGRIRDYQSGVYENGEEKCGHWNGPGKWETDDEEDDEVENIGEAREKLEDEAEGAATAELLYLQRVARASGE